LRGHERAIGWWRAPRQPEQDLDVADVGILRPGCALTVGGHDDLTRIQASGARRCARARKRERQIPCPSQGLDAFELFTECRLAPPTYATIGGDQPKTIGCSGRGKNVACGGT